MADKKDDTGALWTEYKRTGDKAARDRLILTYAPLVKYVAGRLGSGLPAHVDEGDLASYGLLGLIGAIERFDPARDIKFETYAIARIKGSIIDELRSMDWVPRSVRARARDIERTIASARGQARARADGRGDRRLARDHRARSSRTRCSRSRGRRSPRSTSSGRARRTAATPSPSSTRSRTPGAAEPQAAMAHTELREALGEAIARLPEREKLVVTLYYYEELTLREIGEVLGVTESRVSQLHTKAILRLKARLSATLVRTS